MPNRRRSLRSPRAASRGLSEIYGPANESMRGIMNKGSKVILSILFISISYITETLAVVYCIVGFTFWNMWS